MNLPCTNVVAGGGAEVASASPDHRVSGVSDPLKPLRTLWSLLQKIKMRPARKRMRLCETVALGDKRFIAVVQVDDKEFLIAGASNSISLLTELNKRPEFSGLLGDRLFEVNR